MAFGRFSCSLILLMFLQQVITSKGRTDSEILLQFKNSLGNNGTLSNWDASKPPCNGDKPNWTGVLCHHGSIWTLKLENMGLNGKIDVESLSELKSLRTISFMNNDFEGPLPDVKELGALKTIYLSNNKFSGEIPANAFEGMHSIKKIHLANNNFSGPIPASLATLPRLIELILQDNQFEGQIPEFHQNLRALNLANNHLKGPIPASLSKLNGSVFSGNQDLCGAPLKACAAPTVPPGPSPPSPEFTPATSPPPPQDNNSSSSPKLSVATIVILVIASIVALAALVAVVFILRRRKKSPEDQDTTMAPPPNPTKDVVSSNLDKMEKGISPDRSPEANKKRDQNVKLTFLQENREKFDMTDLLKASAEVLGSGALGSSYKAALNAGTVVVVKRYRQMNSVSKEEFHEHMRRLGKLSHPNLLPLVAFYYRKEEKLLVADYVGNVSLAVHLHGNKSGGQPSPDWPTRLKIVKGVARGLLYLYNSLPSLIAPHGHLKSSNVLLTENCDPLLTDYGLLPVVSLEHAQDKMVAYKSPEFKQNGRITKKTDIWSLGLLILEILTGKCPSNFLQQGKEIDTDLATWVSALKKEVAEMEVLDKDMAGTKNGEGEMMKLLKIALTCCEVEIDKRLDIREAVEKIEEIKERDGDDEFYTSFGSEVGTRFSRGFSSDFEHVTLNG